MNELLRLWVSIPSNTIFSHFVCVHARDRNECGLEYIADFKRKNKEKKQK